MFPKKHKHHKDIDEGRVSAVGRYVRDDSAMAPSGTLLRSS